LGIQATVIEGMVEAIGDGLRSISRRFSGG